MALLGLDGPSFERVNVGSDPLSGNFWLKDQPIHGAFQVFRARVANEAFGVIDRLEAITAIRPIAFSEVPLPVADRMAGFIRPRLTECQLRFGLAFEVGVEKVVRDQHPTIVV